MLVELWPLFYAYCLMILNIFTKFYENILKIFKVIERTRFVMDRQADGQIDRQTTMGKTMSPRNGGEDGEYKIKCMAYLI